LKPEYSISKNLWSHIEQSNRSIFQKKLFDDIAENYGLKLDEFYDPAMSYQIHEPIHVPEADSKVIDDFLKDRRSISHKEWVDLEKEAKAVLPALSGDGQRELARQLTSMARDESHIIRVEDAVGQSLMPPLKALKEGDLNPFFLKHGLPEDKARLVHRGGGVWGDQEHLVPKAIADLLDDGDRDLLANAKGELSTIVKVWDKVGNYFKFVTYPLYASGATRDAYNNLQHSFLALGIGGLTRPDIGARIVSGSKGIVELGAHRKTGEQWKDLFASLRITDPSAASYVQATGKEGAEKAGLKSKILRARGQIDNATRTNLAAAGIRMGMEPEDAARMVHEFLYNYAELSPRERDWFRRAFPFIVFPLKTIKLYPGVAAKTPGRLANLTKPFQGRDSENKEMTTWEGEGYKLRLDRNGRDVTVLNGIDLPVRSFDMLYSGGWGKSLERLVGSSHPIPKLFYMGASSREPFRNREMTRASAPMAGLALKHAPKAIQDWAGWKPKTDAAGRTTYTVNEKKYRILLEGAMLSRVFSTGDRYFRDQLKEPGAPKFWMQFFTGLHLKKLNLDAERKKQIDAKVKIAEEEAVKQGTAKQFKKVY
jgi:hypothetical protein